MTAIKNFLSDNQTFIIFLIGQALIFIGYMVTLEGPVTNLEQRGSPHRG